MEKTLRVGVIYNPVAGHFDQRLVQFLANSLASRGHGVSLLPTRNAGDAMLRAQEASPDHDVLVACGGDGTVNEVLCGMRGEKLPTLAVLPCGTTNVLALDLGLPRDPSLLAQAIDEQHTQLVDTFTANNRRGLLFTGVGWDSWAVAGMNKNIKKYIGKGAYVLSGLRAIWQCRHHHCTVKLDDGAVRHVSSVILTNIRCYAGRFMLCPQARIDDGKLYAVLFKRPGIWATVTAIVALAMGRIAEHPDVDVVPFKKAAVSTPETGPVQLDGDNALTTPLLVEIKPKSLKLVTPHKPTW